MCFAPQRRALFRHLNLQKWSAPGVFCAFWLGNVLRATTACTFSTSQLPKWSEHGVFCTFWLRNVLRATTACTFSTSQLPKVVRTWCVLYSLTSKSASHHNGVHFFDISTSKSGPNVVCWLLNVLRATTACTFSTSQLPKVVRTWCVLCILTCKCASRHNGVQFFISHLASWLRTRRFSEPTFRPSGVSRLSYLFAHLHLLSSYSFSSTLLSSNLSLVSASSLLCFSSVHIVGSLTSKLPSIIRGLI